MSGFTKRQWAVGEYDDFSESYTVIQEGSRREGRGYVVTVDICEGASEANAHLIAAAPDLLEAAQLALQIAESWIHDQLDGTSSIDGALLHLDPVRAAIARARGEA